MDVLTEHAIRGTPRKSFRASDRSETDELLLPDALAGILQSEILPRLMRAHRDAAQAMRESAQRPSADQIADFGAMLRDPLDGDATRHVMSLLDHGLSLDGLLLDMLVPTARHLGALWEEDACDFLDVTLAVGRLQAIAREICARVEATAELRDGRRILLGACPGETHVLSLPIIASLFLEDGWDVTVAAPSSGTDLFDVARNAWFDVIGLSLSCEVLLPAMTEAVRDLRATSCNRDACILVGGPYFSAQPDQVRITGADAVAPDGKAAPSIAESLLRQRNHAFGDAHR